MRLIPTCFRIAILELDLVPTGHTSKSIDPINSKGYALMGSSAVRSRRAGFGEEDADSDRIRLATSE